MKTENNIEITGNAPLKYLGPILWIIRNSKKKKNAKTKC